MDSILIGYAVVFIIIVIIIIVLGFTLAPKSDATTLPTTKPTTASPTAVVTAPTAVVTAPAIILVATPPAPKTGTMFNCGADVATFPVCGGAAPSSGTIEYGRFDNSGCGPHPSINANTAIFTKKYPLKEGTTSIKDMNAYVGEDPIPNVYKQYKINYTC